MTDKKPFDNIEFNRKMVTTLMESHDNMQNKIRYLMKQVSLLKSAVEELMKERMIDEST